ncbi:MAG: hypothetical protein ACT4P3_16415 [Betaproteobacteria bacterium]
MSAACSHGRPREGGDPVSRHPREGGDPVRFGMHADMYEAIQREKRLKKWNRAWKIRLIEEMNPEWKDLSARAF